MKKKEIKNIRENKQLEYGRDGRREQDVSVKKMKENMKNVGVELQEGQTGWSLSGTPSSIKNVTGGDVPP